MIMRMKRILIPILSIAMLFAFISPQAFATENTNEKAKEEAPKVFKEAGQITWTEFYKGEKKDIKTMDGHIDTRDIKNNKSKSIYMSVKNFEYGGEGKLCMARFSFMNQTDKDVVITLVSKSLSPTAYTDSFEATAKFEQDFKKDKYKTYPDGDANMMSFRLPAKKFSSDKAFFAGFIYPVEQYPQGSPADFEIYVDWDSNKLPDYDFGDLVHYLVTDNTKYTATVERSDINRHARLAEPKAEKKVEKKTPQKSQKQTITKDVSKNKYIIIAGGLLVVAVIAGVSLAIYRRKNR